MATSYYSLYLPRCLIQWLSKSRWNRGGWDDAWGVGTVLFWFTPFTFQRWRNHFWFIWSDLGACFFLQTFFSPLGNQSHSVFLTPHFAPLPCCLPRSPENRMEAHKSPTCFRWPDKSCVPCLLNLGRLLWLRNGEALPSVGWEYGQPGEGAAVLFSEPRSFQSFPNLFFTSSHVSRAANEAGEFWGHCEGRIFPLCLKTPWPTWGVRTG